MNDKVERDDWRHERSLRELGRVMRGEDDAPQPSGSLLSLAQETTSDWRKNAAERHYMARSRRADVTQHEHGPVDTKPLFDKPIFTSEASADISEDAPDVPEKPAAASGWLPHWALLKREQSQTDRGAVNVPSSPQKQPTGSTEAHPDNRPTRQAYRQPPPSNTRATNKDDHWQPLIDPIKIIGGIARSKALILAMTLLGALAGVSIALSTPKKYEAVTELIVDPRDLKITENDLTQTVIASDATLAIVENQMRVLTSGVVLNKVVDKLNLVSDPEFNGLGGSASMLDMFRSLLSREDGPGGADETRRRALTVASLAESISVERGGKTFVITVSAVTQNGEKSALIANTMTDMFLETYGQIQSDTAGRATDELTARLGELRNGVEDAERKVEEFRAAHDLIDAQGRLISDDELLKLNEQLSLARARTLELNARAASAKAINVDSVLGGALPEEMNSNAITDLRAQYATLKQEADRAAVRLGPRHPERIALEAQLAGARDRIAIELRRIASSLQVDLRRAVQLEQELSARLAQLKVRSGDVSNDLVSLRELEREAAAKRSVYEAFLLRAKETSERRDINTANISVISKAFPPLEPNGPSRALVALAGLLLGFASGVGLGAMRGAYDSLRTTANNRSRDDQDAAQNHEEQSKERIEEPAPIYPQPSENGGLMSARNESDQPSIEEIRASLREFREAVREFTESRARGRRV